MENIDENLLTIIKEELIQLGVISLSIENQQDSKKPTIYQNGTRLLSFTNNINQFRGKTRNKFVNTESPKNLDSNHGHVRQIFSNPLSLNQPTARTPLRPDNMKLRRMGPKSPFASKNRNERKSGRKKAGMNNMNKLSKDKFGQELSSLQLCPVRLNDGTEVNIPEFIIDISNLIRRNITVEGIFRKAGSSQRQNDIKKLLSGGLSLPSSVHPVDAACLLKQFLRSLPTPLLAQPVHYLMTSCLDIKDSEDQQRALCLCTLLLPKTHQDLLAYVLELLSDVAAASKDNMMDAHNLGIVLAPNLLPDLSINGSSSKKTFWFAADDQLLSSTINIMERLIESASFVCRLSEDIVVALHNKEKSHSVENLCDLPPSLGSPKKKRRSASIHRLMNGLRRVVQGSGSFLNSQPHTVSSPVKSELQMTPVPASDRGSVVRMRPDAASPESVKRKSDSSEILPNMKTKNITDSQQLDIDPPKKKPRMELLLGFHNASSYNSLVPADKRELAPSAIFNTRHPKAMQSLVSAKGHEKDKVIRSYSLRERRETLKLFSDNREERIGECQVKRHSSDGAVNSTAGKTPLKAVSNLAMKSNKISASPSTPSMSPLISHPISSILLPLRATTPVTRNSIWRKSLINQHLRSICPDGSEETPLGPRGIPDGSECNIRDFSAADPVLALEQQYDEVKCAVMTMEEQIDRYNIKHIKDAIFSSQKSLELSTMSCSEIIHNAYEHMKSETKDLGYIPSENLSRRLGKELRIRNLCSSEHRVLRSPSERKIGSIRRRSKELEQNAAAAAAKSHPVTADSSEPARSGTPKLKGNLLQSPHSALKRGKPNSVRSGLPVVVKPANIIGLPGVIETPSRAICITKRPPFKRSPGAGSDNYYDSFSSSQNHQESYRNLSESFVGSFTDDYAGPITRRRSSMLSTHSNPLPVLNLNSAESSLNMSSKSFSDIEIKLDDKSLSSLTTKFSKVMNETYTKDFSEVQDANESNALEENLEWVSATTYMKNITEEQLATPTAVQLEPVGNRPSIAALRKQKKVTENVQLFSQLQQFPKCMMTPTSSRRSSRYRRTPSNHIPLRSVISERRCSRSHLPSERFQQSVTPQDGRHSRSRQIKPSSGDLQLAKASKAYSLKERNTKSVSSNFNTPRIISRATASCSQQSNLSKRLESVVFPSLLTPLPPKPFKPADIPVTSKLPPQALDCFETPPRLPPRKCQSQNAKLSIHDRRSH